jgi:lipoprotein-anchoring transpeptidase ErfK/SrfK
MFLRAAAFIAILIGTLPGEALAQFQPPGPPVFVPSPFRPLPPAALEDDDLPLYDPPPGYRGGPPPGAYSEPPRPRDPQALPPPGPYGHVAPSYPSREPAYEPDPRSRGPQQEQAILPPLPLPIPGQPFPGAQPQPDRGDTTSSLPEDIRPESGPRKELPPQFRRTQVDYRTREPAGTIIIDTPNTYLYLVLGNGKAMRYGIGVGREGFTWSGAERVSRMAEWPDWHPPPEMIQRQPYLPRFMAGGEGNPLGARALYLGSTIYRIHGTNQPSTIGTFVSSGCIRLTNEDVTDLYYRVRVGTRVVVLPGRPPATASAAPPPTTAQADPYEGQPIPLEPPPVIRSR